MSRVAKLERGFPLLLNAGYHETSEATGVPGTPGTYNCIAWAAEDVTHDFWWPLPGGYWPFWVRHPEPTVKCFVKTFRSLGYFICESSRPERFFDKVALYAIHTSERPTPVPTSWKDLSDWEPTHMARQLRNGSWTSKCGRDEDIEHYTLDALNSYGRSFFENKYGCAVLYMKRPRFLSAVVHALQGIHWKIESYLT